MEEPISVMAVSCSPTPGGKTRTALEAVLSGAGDAGAKTSLVELAAEESPESVVAAMNGSDAFVFGSPMYRTSYTAQFKGLLDVVPRGMYGASDAPLTARAVLTVATAASYHHLLGASAMRDVLVDFFAAHVVSPGVYLTPAEYDGVVLRPSARERAAVMGLALVELACAIRASSGLRAATPIA